MRLCSFARDYALMALVLLIALLAGGFMFAHAAEPAVVGYKQVCDGRSCHLEPIYALTPAIPATFETSAAKAAGCKCDPPCQCGGYQKMPVGDGPTIVYPPPARFPVARAVVDRQPVRHAVQQMRGRLAGIVCRIRCR